MSFPFAVLEKLLDYAGASGVERSALLREVAIAEGTAVSYPQLCAAYEAAARLTGDADLGLHVGERTRPIMYGLLGYAAVSSGTVREGLERLVRLQAVWSEAVAFELRVEGGAAHLAYRAKEAVPAPARRQECEQMLAALLTFLREATNRDLVPREVRLPHGRPPSLTEHSRIFRCPLRFRSRLPEIVLAEDLLDLRFASADAALAALAEKEAAKVLVGREAHGPMVAQLRAWLAAALRRGMVPSLAVAADHLRLGERSLQRHLKEEGTTWRALLNGARLAAARDLLDGTDESLGRIAFRSGYAQASAFHRAFRRGEGVTPRTYRRRQDGYGDSS